MTCESGMTGKECGFSKNWKDTIRCSDKGSLDKLRSSSLMQLPLLPLIEVRM